jgi:hypothetical protein
MDENVKTIKENLALLRALDPECSESDLVWNEAEKEIIAIAEKMAKEIEILIEEA